MRHGALFNGIGGFQLAAAWMGWENVFHCEIDKFCNRVVKQHFPESICYEDIKKTDFTPWRGKIDIVSGGFPCQPYSAAGLRKGKEDRRHMWPEMLRAIREISPGWVVGENVRGLITWNGGMVFDEVQADLEVAGYEVLPFLLPACGIGAPHERSRIWFIAYSSRYGCNRDKELSDSDNTGILKGVAEEYEPHALPGCRATTNGHCERFKEFDTTALANKEEQSCGILSEGWYDWPAEPPVCGTDDGIPDRVDRIKALGNAVVPPLVFEIFKAIEAFENNA